MGLLVGLLMGEAVGVCVGLKVGQFVDSTRCVVGEAVDWTVAVLVVVLVGTFSACTLALVFGDLCLTLALPQFGLYLSDK